VKRPKEGRQTARERSTRGTLSAPRPAQSARSESAPGDSSASRAARHDAIREVLRAHAVGTQEELGRLLVAEGFQVTQATLSRDLASLSALRVSGVGGGAVYALGGGLAAGAAGRPRGRDVSGLVLFVSESDALCVVRTQPGAAQAVARVIDDARLPRCLGTLAGDDTIFVSPVRGTSPRKLSQTLKSLLGQPRGRDAQA
jgi:transcriptional regulator of arginine metabolism